MRFVVRKAFSTLATSLAIIGGALLAGSCGGGGTEPSTPGSITISPAFPGPIAAGGSVQLTATVLDTKGQAMTGQTVAFTTNAPNIATVSGSGLLQSVGPVGSATITATVGTVHGSVSVTVIVGAAASITRTSPDPGIVNPGETVGDSVRFVVKDAFANPRDQTTVAFSVSAGGGQASPASGQTDPQGRVATMFTTGSAVGTNTLNATVSAITPASLSLTTVESNVSVSSVAPSPMTPGANVTITGLGFDPAASGDAVTIDGQVATVQSASATQLVVTIPTSLPCTPSHQANVRVTASGGSGIGHATLKVGTLRTLAVGSSVVLSNQADVYCTELTANARYAVNVVNSSTAPTAVTPFRFAGATSIPPGTTLSPARLFTLHQAPKTPVFSRDKTATENVQSAHSALHVRLLEANRQILTARKSLFRRGRQRSLSPSVRASIAAAAVPAIGDTRGFRVFKPSTVVGASASCNDFVEISARVAYVGTKAIIYEDVAAPLAGQMDATWATLGQEFDATMYPSDRDNFGDPLITDPDTDADQHLNMVFTPVIPATLAGFVLSCDFFERDASNQVSNFGENFYARVPTVAGTGFFPQADNPDQFLRGMRAVIVHEVKHIAGFGARLEGSATSFEESWLEEGMAMTAEEVWARDRIYPGATWKGDMTYQTTLRCDVRPDTPGCVGTPFVMFDHFAKLYDYLDVPGATSLFGRVADNDFVFYAASWSFIRYNVDRFATSEATYLRGITSAAVNGIANIEQQSGANRNDILANWSLALYLDGTAAMTNNADVNIRSWNTRDIFSGMNIDFPQSNNFPKTHPLFPVILTSGDFVVNSAGIHGGSFSPYDLTGQTGATRTVGVSATTAGSPPPTLFRLVIARTQ
jgi:hypothetical protein